MVVKSLNSYLQLWIISNFNVLIFLRSGHNSRSYIAALTNQSFDLQYFLKCIAFNTQFGFFAAFAIAISPFFHRNFKNLLRLPHTVNTFWRGSLSFLS